MKKTLFLLGIAVTLTFWISSAMALPLEVYGIDGPQDPLRVYPRAHELGDRFPVDELIESSFVYTDLTACAIPGDDPAIPNILVSMTNLSLQDWSNLYYVADPETSISNFDGWIGNAGLNDAEEAFRIDWLGMNQPLVFESMNMDNVFEIGETWDFIIQDYQNTLGGPPTPFDSPGIASLSAGWPPSTGSIISPVPEPCTMLLLGTALAGIGIARFRKKFKKS